LRSGTALAVALTGDPPFSPKREKGAVPLIRESN
jgi:hypothetical protein